MRKNRVIFAVILVFIASGCPKYEDGSLTSLRSKKEEIANTRRVEKGMPGKHEFHLKT